MKVLLDQGLPRSAVRFLNERQIEAEHVGDLGMAKATDAVILAAAVERDAIVVTLDADFHALLASSRSTSPSVVRIRIEDLKGNELAEIIARVPVLCYSSELRLMVARKRGQEPKAGTALRVLRTFGS